jgi:hypothetical protein
MWHSRKWRTQPSRVRVAWPHGFPRADHEYVGCPSPLSGSVLMTFHEMGQTYTSSIKRSESSSSIVIGSLPSATRVLFTSRRISFAFDVVRSGFGILMPRSLAALMSANSLYLTGLSPFGALSIILGCSARGAEAISSNVIHVGGKGARLADVVATPWAGPEGMDFPLDI